MSRQDPGWLRRWWPFYVALAVLAFAVPEAVALATPGDGGTLSEMTREWLGTSEGGVTAAWVALTVVLVGFAVWFPLHLRRWWPWERPRDEEVDAPER